MTDRKKTVAKGPDAGGKISLNPSRTYREKPDSGEVSLNPSRTYKEKIAKPSKPDTDPRALNPSRTYKKPPMK